jgi:hypothetical protein
MKFKWVNPDSSFSSGSSGRVSRAIPGDQARQKAAETKLAKKADPPRPKDKLSNKRR